MSFRFMYHKDEMQVFIPKEISNQAISNGLVEIKVGEETYTCVLSLSEEEVYSMREMLRGDRASFRQMRFLILSMNLRVVDVLNIFEIPYCPITPESMEKHLKRFFTGFVSSYDSDDNITLRTKRAMDIISLAIFLEKNAYPEEQLKDWKLNMEGLDLRELDLEDVALQGSRYDDSTQWPHGFDYINSGAFGPKANLQRVSFRNTSLRGVNLRGADLRGADLCGVDIQEAILDHTNLENTIYNGYTRWPNNFDLRNKGLYLLKKEANLKGADLRHMVFQYNFDLRYSDLSYADI